MIEVVLIFASFDQPRSSILSPQRLGMDYKTIRHHLRVLLRNRMVVEAGGGYGGHVFHIACGRAELSGIP